MAAAQEDASGDLPEPDVEQHDTEVDYTVDRRALDEAAGNPQVWAHEFTEMVGHATGCWLEEHALEQWLNAYGQQVRRETFREGAFIVANTPLPHRVGGDQSLLLLELRDDLTNRLRRGMS